MKGVAFGQENRINLVSDEHIEQQSKVTTNSASQIHNERKVDGAKLEGVTNNSNKDRQRFSENLIRNPLSSSTKSNATTLVSFEVTPEEIENALLTNMQLSSESNQIAQREVNTRNPVQVVTEISDNEHAAILTPEINIKGYQRRESPPSTIAQITSETQPMPDVCSAMAVPSALLGVYGADVFSVLDKFLTIRISWSERKNKKAVRDFIQDKEHITAYQERKNILKAYEACEKDKNATCPTKKLSIGDVKYVVEFEELQSFVKGEKTLKKLTRFKDVGLGPLSELWKDGLFIAKAAAASALPSGLSFVGPSVGLISGTINVIKGVNDVSDAHHIQKKSKEILAGTTSSNIGETTETREKKLLESLVKSTANDAYVDAKENLAQGISRTVNGVSVLTTGALSIAAIAASSASLGLGAAITAAAFGGVFAVGSTRKFFKENSQKKAQFHNKAIALDFIQKNKRKLLGSIYNYWAFRTNKNAFFSLEKNSKITVTIPKVTWFGKTKTDKQGEPVWKMKSILGSDIINNQYVREYILAGMVADFLVGNLDHLGADDLDDHSISGVDSDVPTGRQYIDELKRVYDLEKVNALISKARSVSTFSECMEILNIGIHQLCDLSSIS